MGRNKNVLLAVDDSEGSFQAAQYVADVIGPQPRYQVYLFHVLPSIPPELLEFGGAEDPKKEEVLSDELRKIQNQWIDEAKGKAEPIMNKAKAILHQGGLSPDAIRTEFSPSVHRPDVVRDIIEAAHNFNCGTVVVGRDSFPGFWESFRHHIGKELVEKGQGFAVWVVE